MNLAELVERLKLIQRGEGEPANLSIVIAYRDATSEHYAFDDLIVTLQAGENAGKSVVLIAG